MKSLELNWIRNFDKSLVIPEVIYCNLDCGAGYYRAPSNDIVIFDDKEYDCRYGIIAIHKDYPESFAHNLAHEWRHHWQECHGWKLDYIFEWKNEMINDNYEESIIKYFTLNIDELDALQFAYKYAGINEYWEELLFEYLPA